MRVLDGLHEQAQPDFSAGAFQGIQRSLIPPNGFYSGQNVLLDDDGAAYKRGGSALLSTAAFNAAGLTFLLDAYLSAGQRTLIADAAKFGVLDGAEAPVNIGGAGLASPKRAAIIGGVAVIGGGAMYAGSRKTANYTTGTVSTTNGSKVVTGAATLWLANADAGMFLKIGAERYYVVASVDSDTQVTLTEAYEGTTAAGKAYTLSPLGTAPRTSNFYVAGFDRLISLEGNKVWESRQVSPGGSGFPPVGNSQWQTFDATAFLEIPGGVQITGGYFLGETLFVFTTAGVYAVSDMAYDITDRAGNVQQAVTRISPDLSLWANEGIASWGNAMVVPATDGVWLIDGQSQPQKLSRSIDARYVGYVRAGHKPGLAAVYHNHYLLPILTNAGAIVETLVCRLDRGQEIPGLGVVFPWTWLTGSGANAAAYAVRVGATQRQPKLLAAGMQTSARVLDCSGYFEPSAAVKQDHDATNFEYDLTTRDWTPDKLNVEALIKKIRLRYELTDAAADDPVIAAYYSVGVVQAGVTLWDQFSWGAASWAEAGTETDVPLAGQAPKDDGRHPYSWVIGQRARFIRYRFRSAKPAAKLVIRNLEMFSRQSGRQ